VLGNLLSNAIKFTQEGGCVTVRLETSAGQAQISVRDTGIGIEPGFLPRLFERFHQADGSATRPHGGLGIGLAIVRHLVELHGGSVHAHSEGSGCGATFVLRFPAISAVEEVSLSAEPAAPQFERGQVRLDGMRVLLVDDEPDARECLAFGLSEHGAEVISLACAQDALAALDGGGADVLVSDLAMPDQDGFELIRQVRARAPERGGRIPAAALSAFARPEERARAVLAGFDFHIAKPIDPRELAGLVLELASRGHG
jgi:CheY-like chemotaxis protein